MSIDKCAQLYCLVLLALSECLAANVDLERFAGRWYEIARTDNGFQRHCQSDTQATYELNPDKTLVVTNSCVDENNETIVAKGLAYQPNPSRSHYLNVSFVKLFGFHMFWGDYWILELDINYQTAIVGSPNDNMFWILSRQKTVTPHRLNQLESQLRRFGITQEDLLYTKHSQLD
ncbi:MAG: hypothetical protein CMF46_02145 [Legionellales bacterium]|nr:hypothetical protein [Legionellales bacterium]|tara:strand:+ start:485 stop:1009 length:525 start_codon:yes stop_codon:yes gene_type:complete